MVGLHGKLVALTLVVTAALGRSLDGQGIDRTQRPVVAARRPFAFPRVSTRTLPNGLHIAIVENHALPVVAVRLVLPIDSVADPAGKEGLYWLMLNMLREATSSRSGDQLASAIADLGNPVAPTGFTTITANFDSSLAIMADMITRPAFPDSALSRRRAGKLAAMQVQSRAAATVPRKILYDVLFGAEHPIARSVSASEASVQSITIHDIKRFYDSYVAPENVTLVIAGDVRVNDGIAAATRAFGGWAKRGARYVASVPPARTPAATTIYLFDRPNVAQSYVVAGQVGPARTTPDYVALEAMGALLGATSASRLMQNLRGRHAYMYSGVLTAPVWRTVPEPSVIQGFAAFFTPKTDSALMEWMGELGAIRADRPPTADEMQTARAALTANLPAQIETMDRVADRVALLARNGLPFDFDSRVTTAAGALTPHDITGVARKYLDPEHMTIVVAGDRKLIEPALRAANLGPIVIVDENGNRVP